MSSNAVLTGSSVYFTDLSVGGYPSSWLWTFEGGDPSSSTDQHPYGIVYNSEGQYFVTLKVGNGWGNDSITKTKYIFVSNTAYTHCETITNRNDAEGVYPYPYQLSNPWSGYLPGHAYNSDGNVTAYADLFDENTYSDIAFFPNKISAIVIAASLANNPSENGKVKFIIWDCNVYGLPEQELGSKEVLLSNFVGHTESYQQINFYPSISVDGNFFAGFEIYYDNPDDNFVSYIVNDRGPTGSNTLFVKHDDLWKTATEAFGVHTSLDIKSISCIVVGDSEENKYNQAYKNNILIFPNPSSDYVFIDIGKLASKDVKINIYNIFGNLIDIVEKTEFSDNLLRLDFTSMSSGLYLIKINSQEVNIIKKILIAR